MFGKVEDSPGSIKIEQRRATEPSRNLMGRYIEPSRKNTSLGGDDFHGLRIVARARAGTSTTRSARGSDSALRGLRHGSGGPRNAVRRPSLVMARQARGWVAGVSAAFQEGSRHGDPQPANLEGADARPSAGRRRL